MICSRYESMLITPIQGLGDVLPTPQAVGLG